MAQRAASGRLDQEQTIHTGCNILWAGGILRSQSAQAVIAAMTSTSELFDFLGPPYVPFQNNGHVIEIRLHQMLAPSFVLHPADSRPGRSSSRMSSVSYFRTAFPTGVSNQRSYRSGQSSNRCFSGMPTLPTDLLPASSARNRSAAIRIPRFHGGRRLKMLANLTILPRRMVHSVL